MKKNHKTEKQNVSDYKTLVSGLAALLESARQTAARAVNAVLTTVYWEIGRRIVEFEQKGIARAEYGEELLTRLSRALTRRFGRGFSVDNLETMRLFYIAYAGVAISETPSRKSRPSTRGKSETSSRILTIDHLTDRFPLSWSHYVLLVRKTADEGARAFYETEALRGGWSVRQLDRQMASQFYERTLLSKNKRSLLLKGRAADHVTPEEEIKDPYVLEFLGLKDEYSESDLEEALIQRLEHFLLELGDDFTFVGRQKRLRIGREWYRIDLVFFHRKLKCLVIIDLKVGKFTHADAGQMHLYLNYAREHWTHKGENPPVGLILCAEKDTAVAKYALNGLANKVLAAEYKLRLPDERKLIAELQQTRKRLETGRRKKLMTKSPVKKLSTRANGGRQ
jgi:predicted nuclease of restriction endonuclease-like (RecB) superfamily